MDVLHHCRRILRLASWPFRNNRWQRIPGRAWDALRLSVRAGTWPVRKRRLPSRKELHAFRQAVLALLPGRLVRLLTGTDPEHTPATVEPPRAEPFIPPPVDDRYQVWIENNPVHEEDCLRLRDLVLANTYQPRFSIIMPVFNIEDRWLTIAIRSVIDQAYPHWELCIADDASTLPTVRPLLESFARSDPRITLRFLPENRNISGATNAAAELATGEYLVFLDQDDELTPDCLLELALAVQRAPESDVLYSDDDKIDAHGNRYDPQFKPDWSPELLLAYMYFSHVFAVRRELFNRVGGCRLGFEGTQDYDLALRVTEQARRVTHIPRVLYHWRCLPGSTADSGTAKPASFERGIRAIEDALQRRGITGKAARPSWAVACGCGIFEIDFPDTGPLVSIIIPTRNQSHLLKRCLTSILAKTTYRNYEVLVIDNDSDDRKTLRYLSNLPAPCKVLKLTCPGGKFNYAWLNNEAVRHVTGEYVLFLNNDTEVYRPEWLSQMVGYAQMDGVGAVGARLLFPDGRIQHAGIVTGLYHGVAGPAFKLADARDPGYLAYTMVSRNYSAVTAACLLMRRDDFEEMDGFDERRFAVAYNDVDLCLRLRHLGRRCVFAPRAELLHHEGASRGFGDNPRELLAFKETWGNDRDPYYNPNLSLDTERFGISTRGRVNGEVHTHTPIRLLMCAHSLNLEGAPYSQFQLAVGLKKRGRFAPEIYCPDDGPLAHAYRSAGIPVFAFPYPYSGVTSPDRFDESVRAIAGWMRQRDYQVIYSNTMETFWAIHAAAHLQVPSVWNIRESADWRQYFSVRFPQLNATALSSMRIPYRVIFVADATRAMYEALNTRGNFSTIHNGIDLSEIQASIGNLTTEQARGLVGHPSGKTVFTIVGTVCPRKGQLEFARGAIAILKQGITDAYFCIVGCRGKAYEHEVEEAIEPYREHFALIAETKDVHPYFRASDVFVCCSNNESYPRVILEAMAFGLPIITTNVFGISEQVCHRVSALTYAPTDIKTLSNHMRQLARDPGERKRLGENARTALAGLTTYDEMLEGYEQILLEAFHSRRREAVVTPQGNMELLEVA